MVPTREAGERGPSERLSEQGGYGLGEGKGTRVMGVRENVGFEGKKIGCNIGRNECSLRTTLFLKEMVCALNKWCPKPSGVLV